VRVDGQITSAGQRTSVSTASEPVLDIPSPTPDHLKQKLRLRRFLFASAFSVLYLIVLGAFHMQDKIGRATLLQACSIVGALIIVFSGVFRAGLNLRFPDPSLTGWQLLASVFTMLYIVYRAPDTRLVFTAFFFVAFMFGMLRHSGVKLAVLGSVSLFSFALMSLGAMARSLSRSAGTPRWRGRSPTRSGCASESARSTFPFHTRSVA